MPLSHRLRKSMFVRPDEETKQQPRRVVFLSVEGNVTECDYFNFIHIYRERLGIKSVVHVEVLSRSDTRSDLKSVYDLLDDYLQLHIYGISAHDIESALDEAGKDYSLEEIEVYLSGKLKNKNKKEIENATRLVGIDLSYQLFLSNYRGSDNNDVFAIVIDRDANSHTEEDIRKVFEGCDRRGLKCFITNPCFEFWLLLHVCDVKTEMENMQQLLLQNPKVSKKHTFVSRELSSRMHHTKRIPKRTFEESYLPNIDNAILRAIDYGKDRDDLLDKLGTNIPQLFSILRGQI